MRVTTPRRSQGRRHELYFADHSGTAANWPAGANGTRSKVRTLLSAAVPLYCGVWDVELHLANAHVRHP